MADFKWVSRRGNGLRNHIAKVVDSGCEPFLRGEFDSGGLRHRSSVALRRVIQALCCVLAILVVTFSFVYGQEATGPGEERLLPAPGLSAGPDSTLPDYVPGVVVVYLDSASGGEVQARRLVAALPEIKGMAPLDEHLNGYEVYVNPGRETAVAASLRDLSGVRAAEPDYLFRTTATIPNDPLYETYQWNLYHIGADRGWDRTQGNRDIVIAVVDTGVDLDHPDLAAKLVPGYDMVNDDAIPADDSGHGTHVASIAAADTNNGQGVAGVAWGARIMPIKVLDAGGNGRSTHVAAGIIWAVNQGADVINLSLGGSNASLAVAEAIDYAYRQGVLVVAAAGNQFQKGNPTIYPAAYDHVLAVAAITDDDRHASYSSSGPFVDVAAPGGDPSSSSDSNIRHWIPGAYWRGAGGVGYAWLSGTSQAAPHVAGLAGLLLSLNREFTPDQLTSIITGTAHDVQSPGWDEFSGYGRVDIAAALDALASMATSTPTATPTPTQSPTPTPTATPTVPVRPKEDIRINANAIGDQGDAALVIDAGGNLTVLWREDHNQDAAIFSARAMHAGISWGPNARLATLSAAGAPAAPAAAVDVQGNVHAVWQDQTPGGDGDLYYTSLETGRAQWQAPTQLGIDAMSPANQANPALIVADDGRWVMLWEDDRHRLDDATRSQIYWSERLQGSASWRTPEAVSLANADQQELRLALGKSHLYAIWIERGETTTLQMASKALTAVSWSAPATLVTLDPAVDQYTPDIVAGPDGTLTVVWAERRAPARGIDIFAIQKSAQGHDWTPITRVNQDMGDADQTRPRLAASEAGLALVWEDRRAGDADIYLAWQAPGTGTWSTGVRANQDRPGFQQRDPVVALDAQGNTTVVWTDSRTGSTAPDLYSRFIAANARFQTYLAGVYN